jgi:hypothetical protein
VEVGRWVVVDISEIPGAFAPDEEPGLSREQREIARARLRKQPPPQKARLEQAAREFPNLGITHIGKWAGQVSNLRPWD